jgi:hypothetical protein
LKDKVDLLMHGVVLQNPVSPPAHPSAPPSKLLNPLNRDHEPEGEHLAAAAQPVLRRRVALHRAAHTLYSTGIGWRNDKVSEDIAKLDNPCPYRKVHSRGR